MVSHVKRGDFNKEVPIALCKYRDEWGALLHSRVDNGKASSLLFCMDNNRLHQTWHQSKNIRPKWLLVPSFL